MEERVENLEQYERHFEGLCGVPCARFDRKSRTFCERAYCSDICGESAKQDYAVTHCYGCAEARRWGNRFFYYGPCGFVFIAVTLDGDEDTAVIAGPIRMEGDEDTPSAEGVVTMAPAQVTHLSALMLAVLGGVEQLRRQLADDRPREAFLAELYRIADEPEETRAVYPIAAERDLRRAIMDGDVMAARAVLNHLLGYVFFSAGVDIDSIKARTLELLVLISRYAIEGGADPQTILPMNDVCIQEIRRFSTLDDLSVWLGSVLNRFIGCVFEFRDVKHADTLRKLTRYLNENYAGRLTLDDVAEHVFLSKSYVSRLFSEELGTTFTAYLNHIRVEKAKIMLVDRGNTLSAVAVAVGFADQSYFSRVFKAITHVSPGVYREQHYKE
ncbi:MAG: AraC family transcriptional regulator [Clostridiaceae bacterium]|nr:AraC family transcriptional regulator [Clostridiaceae bacterium]